MLTSINKSPKRKVNNDLTTSTNDQGEKLPQEIKISKADTQSQGAVIRKIQGTDGQCHLPTGDLNSSPGDYERISLSVNCDKKSPVTVAC